jgi:hypothetical protein
MVISSGFMSEKEKAKSIAAWDAFAERCKEAPVEVKPKAKAKAGVTT